MLPDIYSCGTIEIEISRECRDGYEARVFVGAPWRAAYGAAPRIWEGIPDGPAYDW
jgi:hypothetical protein